MSRHADELVVCITMVSWQTMSGVSPVVLTRLFQPQKRLFCAPILRSNGCNRKESLPQGMANKERLWASIDRPRLNIDHRRSSITSKDHLNSINSRLRNREFLLSLLSKEFLPHLLNSCTTNTSCGVIQVICRN